ncbi:putative DNA-binding domain-containing protein [Novosphingobium piscinae]|uniref:Putative DNA-binding domain-containing protein n=2 Tax=Novosphingobium piscinae TaxID=1507448 RepID=A0A7X1FZC8_9SPHN|nr:DNA-binding domain-containing protein [Novosphingobium piscinae]MBC2669783.1 putative DNA-binding domain-containing protein [Novosphingobium piscinae]
MQADFRAWLVEADEAAGARLGPTAGLAVYQNNYRASLMGSLEATFPRLELWLGSSAFAAAAAHYADQHPPHSWTLDAFGARFADALVGLYPDDPEVAELARIEWAVGQAFVAADAAPVDPAMLAAVNWDTAGLQFVQSLVRLELVSNADALWLALVAEEQPPAVVVERSATTLLVWRQGFESVMRRADPAEITLLELALAGHSFAELCGKLALQFDETAAVAMAGHQLGRWIGDKLIAAID